MEDRIAISRLKQGNSTALEALVQRYQVSAVHAAYAVVRDRALAEDIAQAHPEEDRLLNLHAFFQDVC